MPETALSRLQTLVPYWGDADPAEVPVRALRLSLVLLAVLSPLYGLVYEITSPGVVDPWSVRLAVGAFSIMGLVASYRVRFVRDHAKSMLAVSVVAALGWYGWLVVANGLAANYALGYLFIDVASAMVFSLAWDRTRPVAAVLGGAIVIGAAIAFTVEPAATAIHPLVFLTVLATGSCVVWFVLRARIEVAGALRESETRLADAERLTCTGAWTLDVNEGTRRWSDGAYDVLGVPRSTVPPPSLFDFVHSADLGLCRAEYERMLGSGGTVDFRFRAVRPDGEIRWLHSTAELDGPGRLRGAFVDVTEQVARECELVRARDQAEAASRATREFLANMSHEIRTPLTAIIGFAQLLREETGDTHTFLVEPIENAGRRLLGTLNSVLDLARMEAGETDLALEPTDLGTEAADVVEMLRPHAETKGLTLHYDGPRAPLQALADADALGRVVTNLVSNAIKFTTEGGVVVRLAAEAGRAVLVVEDTGRGMDEAFLRDLFQPFRQASTGWARSHEGTGLGMTITRRLVEAMEGTVLVESRPGAGTRFTVSFPLLEPVRAARISALEPAAV